MSDGARRSIELFIKPAIGSFKVVDVERRDIADLHHAMRDKPYQANRTLGVLSKTFNLAEVWGLRPDGSNPCRHVHKYAETKLARRFLGEEALETETQDALTMHGPEARQRRRDRVYPGCRLTAAVDLAE